MADRIDLNCDMGELAPGTNLNFDHEIMPFISSCNVACGFHSGTASLIENTLRSALALNVAIGAHPSYNDPANFGRKSLVVDSRILFADLRYQISAVKGMVESLGGELRHVKAHGALYNDMINNVDLARGFVNLVGEIDPKLSIIGFSGSCLQQICQKENRKFINEVFADRTYESGKQLRSRKLENALIHNSDAVLKQVGQFLKNEITDYSGKTHFIKAESICLHSDTKGAVNLARQISNYLKTKNVEVCTA